MLTDEQRNQLKYIAAKCQGVAAASKFISTAEVNVALTPQQAQALKTLAGVLNNLENQFDGWLRSIIELPD